MKQLIAWYTQSVWKRMVLWLEEYLRPGTQSFSSTKGDANVLRSSVHRFFKYNQQELLYIVPCDPVYELAIENIRNDGWNVELHAGTGGELFYTISTKPTIVKS